jgi:hypothetical protein
VQYTGPMRGSLSASIGPIALLSALAWVYACSSSSNTASPGDAGAIPADDGSTEGCTSIGGTCESFMAGCPLLQQNPSLCGNVLLVCCLQPGGPTIVNPSDASGDGSSGDDQGDATSTPPPDAGGGDDTGTPPPPDDAQPPPPKDSGTTPPKDSGTTPPDDAGGAPKDATPE